MAEKNTAEELALQAHLYASGELAEPERAAFEERLAADQSAREALAEAVYMNAALRGEAARPDPSYRDRVRQRLRPSWWQRLLARRNYRGHPLLWSAVGAAAALLIGLSVPRPEPEIQVIVREAPAEMPPAGESDTADAALQDISYVWAELSTPDHTVRAHAEENQRKSRQEDRRRTRRNARPPAVRQ